MDQTGLTSEQVRDRIKKGLQNRSTRTSSKKISTILLENLFSIFNLIILLVVIFLLIFYLRTGDRRLFLDSIGALSVAVINTLIAVIQEIRAKFALDKVNLLLRREVKVVRDGSLVSIDQKEIVQGDLIFMERGDQASVDGKVQSSGHLEIDESLLTGESVPIDKKDGDEILSGSFCISGSGYYTAEKVGDESYASEITRLAKKFKLNVTPLQVRINQMVKWLFASALGLILLNILFQDISFGYVESVRKVSTIILSLVPQGLVLMASVTFALGVYRISKLGAIVQKLNAIESFSNVKVVCTDKTGTLTQNKLSVYSVTPVNDNLSQEEIGKMLGTYAEFSSEKNATLRCLEKFESYKEAEKIDELPFSSELKMSIQKLKYNSKENTFVLGGFDILLELTEQSVREKLNGIFTEKRLEVYRNLLFGKVNSDKPLRYYKDNPRGLLIEPICIVSITDLIRKDVNDAIKMFDRNNIEIKILSGDSAPAIQAVAREIGWEIPDDKLISGNEIDKIEDISLAETVRNRSIFARLKPEHKLRIIKALKKEKIYTAMIGDGVNDLPAIKESDMGIAMEEGSAITKEVADIVLLQNKFALLPSIFDEGNRIVNTVSSAAKLFLTKNFMVIFLTLMSLSTLLFHFPLTPRRVALINVFAIGLPAMIIAFRNVNVSKPPHFMKDIISFVIVSAGVISAAAYIGQLYTENITGIVREDQQMVVMSIIIIISIANYLAVAVHKGEKNFGMYLVYGALILLIFVVLAITQFHYPVFKLLKLFYEISYLKPEYWAITAAISITGALVLLVLQKLREKFIA